MESKEATLFARTHGLDQYVIEWVLVVGPSLQVGTKISGMKTINLSIVQGSGVGPCLFIILIADLTLWTPN